MNGVGLVARLEHAVKNSIWGCQMCGQCVCTTPGVAGLHFISFRKDAGIAALCTRLGIAPRQERESHEHSASIAL